MLAKRIIPCLDVKAGKVVKGLQFNHHKIVGDILERAIFYCESGADELVFYDITASCDLRTVSSDWINEVAKVINIPFCVAGGIRALKDAEMILNAGADKISINSPALENPALITQLAKEFGTQCVVVGIDSLNAVPRAIVPRNDAVVPHHDAVVPRNDAYNAVVPRLDRGIQYIYQVCQYTGDVNKIQNTNRLTIDWVKEVKDRGAGEIVLNCMNQDGMRKGYDIVQLQQIRKCTTLPLIASGGAGCIEDFVRVFRESNVDGALAASVFHANNIHIAELKENLRNQNIEIRQ